jgi:hypothetical protein
MSNFKIGDIVATDGVLGEKAYYEVGEVKFVDKSASYLLYPITPKGHVIGLGRWGSDKDTPFQLVTSIPDTILVRDMLDRMRKEQTERLNITERSAKLEAEKSYYEKLRDDYVVRAMSEYMLHYPYELSVDEVLGKVMNTANMIIDRLRKEQL